MRFAGIVDGSVDLRKGSGMGWNNRRNVHVSVDVEMFSRSKLYLLNISVVAVLQVRVRMKACISSSVNQLALRVPSALLPLQILMS